MRVVVDYPTFVGNNAATQVFYTFKNGVFMSAYIRSGVTFMLVELTQPSTFAADFMTAINVIDISET